MFVPLRQVDLNNVPTTFKYDDVILDDINKRLKRVNFQYSNAIWYLFKNYKIKFLQIFIMRIEKK